MRLPPIPLWKRLLYGVVESCFVLFSAPFLRVEVENRPDFDRLGPVVLAPNHVSYLDPAVLQHACRRHVTFLMTATIYQIRLLRWFFRFWGAIPVPEGAVASQAMKDALVAIRSGRLVAIFPEGRISRDGRLNPGRGGVVTLIARGGVPVIPVAILGTFEVLPRHRLWPRRHLVRIRFGEPIPPPGRLAREEIPGFAGRIMDGIAALGAPAGGS